MYSDYQIAKNAYNEEKQKLFKLEKDFRLKENYFNFSPSEFAFGFEGCQKCFYDRKVNKLELKTAIPAIFSKIDIVHKNYYHNKSSKVISEELEEGVIYTDHNKMLKSDVLYDLKDRPFTMGGKIDAYIKHKDSFTIVDFKTTNINEKKIDTYATQLQSYALMMENPKAGSLRLEPVKKLGIFCFEPNSIKDANTNDCNMVFDTKWFEIKRDDQALLRYITKIQDILYAKDAPPSGSSCGTCKYREEILNANR